MTGRYNSFINPAVLARFEEYAQAFATAKPFRHVVIDDFLRPEIAEKLLADFPHVEDPSKLVNEFGGPNPKSAISDVRSISPFYREFDDFVASEAFTGAMSEITAIPDLRYDPHYYGAGTHENFHDAGLDAHYDFNMHPISGLHRRMNAIVYLNKDWNPEWGGQICLHTDPYDYRADQVKEIEAVFNRCIIFETNERSWHSVSTVNVPEDKRHLSRKSFTIYNYTETRPAEELAAPHATVYVQEGLAPEIRAGHTLTEADVARLEKNLSRRNTYLQNLYDREYEFSETVENLKRRLAATQRVTGVPINGKGKVLSNAVPLEVDGWMGERLEFDMRLGAPITGIEFELWRPDGSPRVTVRASAAGESVSMQTDEGYVVLRLPFPAPQEGDITVKVEVEGMPSREPGTDLRVLTFIPAWVNLLT